MQDSQQIKHTGIVIDTAPNQVSIAIQVESACQHCYAKGSCAVANSKEKIIDVTTPDLKQYAKGDLVSVILKQKLGYKALLLGYVLPFLLLIVTLIIAAGFTTNDAIAAIAAIGILIPYYLVIYLLRDKLHKTFRFSIEKQ